MLIHIARVPLPTASKDLSDVAAILPAYNEQRNIARSLTALLSIGVGRIVVVNDASTDSTGAIIDGLADGKRIFPLHHARNAGKEGAVVTGLRFALRFQDVEAFAFLDSDMQVDPAILPRLCTAIGRNDFVIGARARDASMPWIRRMANSLANLPYRALSRIPMSDVQSGLRVYSRRLAEILAARLTGRARYALEHTSLFALASYAIDTGTRLKAAEVDVVCRYGDTVSHIRSRDILQLIAITLYFSMIAVPLKRLLRVFHAKGR